MKKNIDEKQEDWIKREEEGRGGERIKEGRKMWMEKEGGRLKGAGGIRGRNGDILL